MKIATWNVNSIRPRLPILLDWLKENAPDVICLQETKVQDHEFPEAEIREAGYYSTFRGMKSYNGVATLTRTPPEKVEFGLEPGVESDDFRIVQTTVSGIPIINTYVPQGSTVPSDKYTYKLAWFARLRRYFDHYLDPAMPAIWLGDLNVAPEPIDVYHPDRRTQDPDFHIDARNAYKATRDWGFVDVYRQLHPETVQFTYWDYYRDALKRNFGWRIDHILATEPLARRCSAAEVDMRVRHQKGSSDHTILWAVFD